jgi:predicted TIM-barrel fold metal-dependent hydrolase
VPLENDSEIEYGTDTTRAAVRMIYSGSSQRYPDIKMIWSHAGGTLPFLQRRFLKDSTIVPALKNVLPNGFMPEAQRFYYDIAQAAVRPPMLALKAFAPMSHILFGTDYPYLTAKEMVDGLKECKVFNERELRAIDENALAFLPRIKALPLRA